MTSGDASHKNVPKSGQQGSTTSDGTQGSLLIPGTSSKQLEMFKLRTVVKRAICDPGDSKDTKERRQKRSAGDNDKGG